MFALESHTCTRARLITVRCSQPIATSFDRFVAGYVCNAPVQEQREEVAVHAFGSLDAFVEQRAAPIVSVRGQCGGLLRWWELGAGETAFKCNRCERTVEKKECDASDEAGAAALNAIYRSYASSLLTPADLHEFISSCSRIVYHSGDIAVAAHLHPLHYVRFNAAMLLQKFLESAKQWTQLLEVTAYLLSAMRLGELDSQCEYADQLEKLARAMICVVEGTAWDAGKLRP